MTGRPLWMVGHLTVDDVVLPDGTTRMGQVGGAPVFAAAGARMAGTEAAVVTALAPDLPPTVTSWLDREGLTAIGCGATRSHISQWVLYERDGTRTFLHHPGSADILEAAPDPRAWTPRPGCGWAHIAPMPVDVQVGWVRTLAAHGMRVTLDPHEDCAATAADRVLALLPLLTAFLPSEQEAASLHGDDDMLAAATRFVAAGARICAIKVGAAGCVVATAAGTWRVPSIARGCVDPTGAGDAFCGAFTAALAAGADAALAARWGTVAASYTIERFGVPPLRDGAPPDWAVRLERTSSQAVPSTQTFSTAHAGGEK